MRHFLKSFLISVSAFYITYTLIPAMSFGNDPKNAAILIFGLWIISQVINPIFSLVLLPINLLTFGLISALFNVAFFFALSSFLPGFSISAFDFEGANLYGIILPAVSLNQIATTILIALTITFLQKILKIIFD